MHVKHSRKFGKRCMRGGRHGGPLGGRWGGEGWGHGRRHGGGGRRLFEQGDLKLVVLALIAEAPRHGYEIIKEIEARAGGVYAPSPGVIYPLLTLLEDMGFARLSEGDGAKKLYAITPEGEAELAAHRAHVDALLQRIAAVGERFSGARTPQIVRAFENLKLALRLRLERGPLEEAQIEAIAAAIDSAAQAVERS